MNSTRVTGIVGVINPTPDIVTFINTDGVTVLTIHHDGRITVGDGIDPSEAGRLAAEMMGSQLATMIRDAVEAEREACAKVAVAYAEKRRGGGTWDEARALGALDVAERIRARGAR